MFNISIFKKIIYGTKKWAERIFCRSSWWLFLVVNLATSGINYKPKSLSIPVRVVQLTASLEVGRERFLSSCLLFAGIRAYFFGLLTYTEWQLRHPALWPQQLLASVACWVSLLSVWSWNQKASQSQAVICKWRGVAMFEYAQSRCSISHTAWRTEFCLWEARMKNSVTAES